MKFTYTQELKLDLMFVYLHDRTVSIGHTSGSEKLISIVDIYDKPYNEKQDAEIAIWLNDGYEADGIKVPQHKCLFARNLQHGQELSDEQVQELIKLINSINIID